MSVRECEDLSLKRWTSGFRECLARNLVTKKACVEHMTRRWKVRPAWRFSRVSRGKGLPAKYLQNILFGKVSCFVLPSLYPHYMYPHYLRKYTWVLEIVIPTIIYTFPCGFTQLLPLHLYILERLITQTLTTPNLGVKWDFGVVWKHWKEPFIGGCNRAELQDPKS